jgi:phenylpropionate dioxygenase-like ring-hydroxylating dioxygenase large terminal subunit
VAVQARHPADWAHSAQGACKLPSLRDVDLPVKAVRTGMADAVLSRELSPASPLGDPLLKREWLAVAWSRDVGRGAIVPFHALGQDLILWRSAEGLHCWRDLCVHRGARLSLGAIRPADTRGNTRDCLVCPYHAWQYAPTGECVHIPAHAELTPPAKARVETFAVRERYGVVWGCFGDPAGELPAFDLAEDTAFRTVLAGPYRFRAQGPRVIENLLDVAHLGFVHAGLLGDPQRGEIEDYLVTAGTDTRGPEAKQIRIWQPDPDGTGKAALVSYHYWVAGPLTAGFIKSHGVQRFGILAQVAPVDEEHCESRLIMSLNYGHEIPDEELLAFQDRVSEQDRVVVESQRPELLPLDLQAELHLRSDRMAIAYRKWLRALGFTYGTA